jgi:hypothetical protein
VKVSINSINIVGFKSIKELIDLQFKDLNIIVGTKKDRVLTCGVNSLVI